jgi:hypothetical protein
MFCVVRSCKEYLPQIIFYGDENMLSSGTLKGEKGVWFYSLEQNRFAAQSVALYLD